MDRTRVPNGPITTFLATVLTFSGVAGIVVSLLQLGVDVADWPARAPEAVPRLVAGACSVVCGVLLGLGPSRWAVAALVATFLLGVAWQGIAPGDWYRPTAGTLGLFALLHALWLRSRDRAPAAPPA